MVQCRSDTRNRLAQAAFEQTAQYDLMVSSYLARVRLSLLAGSSHLDHEEDRRSEIRRESASASCSLSNLAALGIANAEVLSGKEMSFNNYVDAEAAWQLVCDFEQTACAIIKHTNPSGVGVAETPAEAYRKALATDPVSAFGGIVAFNRRVDADAAQEVTKIFTEVVIAPDYDPEALEILRTKKNLRVIRMNSTEQSRRI